MPVGLTSREAYSERRPIATYTNMVLNDSRKPTFVRLDKPYLSTVFTVRISIGVTYRLQRYVYFMDVETEQRFRSALPELGGFVA